MITDIEDYFLNGCGRCKRFATPECSTRRWHTGLADLRRICTEAGAIETVKWGHPCYMHADRNIALIGAFRDDFRLTFFKAALMKDPVGLLERPGPNTQTRNMIRFSDAAKVLRLEPVIRAYLGEAMTYAEAGLIPKKQPSQLALPDELVSALDDDPELAEGFANLTPGRQKSYVLNLNAAKKAATRTARIAGFRDKILAGKAATER